MPKKKIALKNLEDKNFCKIKKTFANKLLELIPKYAQVRDIFLASWQHIKRANFFDFVSKIEYELEKADDKKRDIIFEKFSKIENDIILSEIVNSALFAKSQKCRVMLSLIAAKYLSGDEIDYFDSLIILTLKDLMDYEIEVFAKCVNLPQYEHQNNEKFPILKFANYTINELLAFEKLTKLNLLIEVLTVARMDQVAIDFLLVKKSVMSDRFCCYLEMCGN